MKSWSWEWGFFGWGYVKAGAQKNLVPYFCFGIVRVWSSWSLLYDAVKKEVGL